MSDVLLCRGDMSTAVQAVRVSLDNDGNYLPQL